MSLVLVQSKVQMLDNLLDIEVAYSLLRGGAEDNGKDPIDINYEKLKTKIEVSVVPFHRRCICHNLLSLLCWEGWSPDYLLTFSTGG